MARENHNLNAQKNKKGILVGQADQDVILRTYIEEGIKELYLNRKHLFHDANKDYSRLSEAYSFITDKIRGMVEKSPSLMIPGDDNFSLIPLTDDIANDICDYMHFILISPPNNFRLKPRVKRYTTIGLMKVPSLDFLLLTLLDFKIPTYWTDKIPIYYSASIAIIQIISKNTASTKVSEISSKITMPDKNSDEWTKIVDFSKKFTQWIRLGLIG